MKKLFILTLSLILIGCASGQRPQDTGSAAAEWNSIVQSAGLTEKTTKIDTFELCYH